MRWVRSGDMAEREARVQSSGEPKEALEPLIYSIDGRRVILDADLARLYGVSTKRFNEAFRRNQRRFPQDFAFRLGVAEFESLRARVPSTQPIDSLEHKPIWSQFATRYGRRRRLIDRPWAFTEHGALMAANVIRSERAVHMSIYVIRAFVRLRERAASNAVVLQRLAEIDSTPFQHDAALRDVYRKLSPLLQPPADPPKRRIGFHADDA